MYTVLLLLLCVRIGKLHSLLSEVLLLEVGLCPITISVHVAYILYRQVKLHVP